jgi:hypothetical protein
MSKKVVERQADYTSCLDVDTINSLTESRCPSETAWRGLYRGDFEVDSLCPCLCVLCESAAPRLASDEDTQQT